MITRIEIDGFKSFLDFKLDVHLEPEHRVEPLDDVGVVHQLGHGSHFVPPSSGTLWMSAPPAAASRAAS